MNNLLTGKTVLVTGGANGIGRAIAAASAQHGATAVIVMDQTSAPRDGSSVEELVRAAGAQFHFHQGDVTNAQTLADAVALADAYGGLDVMVCNAGMALADDNMDLSDEQYDRLIDVNLKGVFKSARAAAKNMIARGRGGSIVIIASMGGVRGSAHTLTYSATKGAARLYAAAFADTLGPHGIRVNAVCPGIIETGFAAPTPEFTAQLKIMAARTPLRRFGQPEEVANTVVWLGSDLSSFVTGASITVDGGLTAVL